MKSLLKEGVGKRNKISTTREALQKRGWDPLKRGGRETQKRGLGKTHAKNTRKYPHASPVHAMLSPRNIHATL